MMQSEHIQLQILHDMDEGVMVLGRDGKIQMVNPRAEVILGKSTNELQNKKFAALFFEYDENDAFNQTILDAVYEPDVSHKNVVEYFDGETTKYLNITTSGYHEGNHITGVIIVLSDITELMEVKERLKMMKEIEQLNKQLKTRNTFIRKAFGKYLSSEIVEQILDSPEGLKVGGKLEHVTVLMSDLRGFTLMCEQIEPEKIMMMLNFYLDRMGRIIREHHGTIIEYMGDGILAVFGAPTHKRKHAENALAAALNMQMAMEEINLWNTQHGYPELKMGIGINTGDAVVGNMGSDYAMKYNIIGGCVNLCGRIESYTTQGQIFISPYTKEEISAALTIDEQLEIKPKGIKNPITIYSICGMGEPYDLHREKKEELPIWLESVFECMIYPMDGKHVSEQGEPAVIKGKMGEKLILKTKLPLKVYDNVFLKQESEMYGKVAGTRAEGYVITPTAGNIMEIGLSH